MAEALWELNSKGTLAHFYGVVLDERPMLVIAYEEVGSILCTGLIYLCTR